MSRPGSSSEPQVRLTVSQVAMGGQPTPEETAAVLVALELAARQDAAAQGSRQRPGWVEAARREALGHPLFDSPGAVAAAVGRH